MFTPNRPFVRWRTSAANPSMTGSDHVARVNFRRVRCVGRVSYRRRQGSDTGRHPRATTSHHFRHFNYLLIDVFRVFVARANRSHYHVCTRNRYPYRHSRASRGNTRGYRSRDQSDASRVSSYLRQGARPNVEVRVNANGKTPRRSRRDSSTYANRKRLRHHPG